MQVQLQVHVESEEPVGERRRRKTYIVYFSWVNLKNISQGVGGNGVAGKEWNGVYVEEQVGDK